MNQIFKEFLRQANTCLEFLPESFFWEVVDKCIPRDMEIPEELRALNGYKKGEHIDLDKAPDSEFAKLQQLLHEFKAKDAQLVQEREVSLENAAMNAANS